MQLFNPKESLAIGNKQIAYLVTYISDLNAFTSSLFSLIQSLFTEPELATAMWKSIIALPRKDVFLD